MLSHCCRNVVVMCRDVLIRSLSFMSTPSGILYFYFTIQSDLHHMFADFGEIEELCILKDRNRKSKCSGFVTFKKQEAATGAIQALNTCVTLPVRWTYFCKLAYEKRVQILMKQCSM